MGILNADLLQSVGTSDADPEDDGHDESEEEVRSFLSTSHAVMVKPCLFTSMLTSLC